MRRLLAILVLSLGLVPVAALAEERVVHFDSHITVNQSGLVTVDEVITYDFGAEPHHGIFRDIPNRSDNRRTPIKVVKVTIDGQESNQYDTSGGSGVLSVKIGDPDVTIQGQHVYGVRYEVQNAINWFDGEPELYWNATGNDWTVAIERVRVVIDAATGATAEKTKCFTGAPGSQATDCGFQNTPDGVQIGTASTLQSGEGLTVVARLSATAVPQPTATQRITRAAWGNVGFLLPIVAFILLWRVYRTHGRDPQGRGTIIPEYDPPAGLSPAMVGYLIDERIDSRDITATIIGLAEKGTLKITYEDQSWGRHSYRLTKTSTPGLEFTQFERQLHSALFTSGNSVTLKELQKTFPRELQSLKKELQNEAQQQKYFTRRPHVIMGVYIAVGFVALFLGIGLMSVSIAWGAGLLLSGVITMIFAPFMPQRSEKGVTITEQIKGFKRFLSVTDKDRIKFHNAPEKKPEQFMAFLPFAVALGVEKDWAKQFASLTIPQPDWYQGNWSTFNTMVLASSLSDFSKTAAAQGLVAASSGGSGFSGGGFSGGGFGGGGGGSW